MSKSDMKRDSEKRFRSKFNRKHWRDYRLRELEKQLEFAESRCGTLKKQLDYVKVLYGCGKPSLPNNEDFIEFHDKKENQFINAERIMISCEDLSRWNKGASDFGDGDNGEKCSLPKTLSYTNTTRASTNSSNKQISSKSSFEKKEMMNENGKEPIRQKNKVKLAKGKRKKVTGNFKHKLKNKGTEPRYSNASCQTLWPVWQDPIVELYKNTSANVTSESAADISYKNKRPKLDHLKVDTSKASGKLKKSSDSNEQLIPATKLKAFTSFKSLDKVYGGKDEGIQTEQGENENEKCSSSDAVNNAMKFSEKPYYESEQVKSYCQPTISSQKKRVERNFFSTLNNLNLKNIPFIAATSTAPSHNIGVNIQQVLSIMKKRQPNNNGDIFPILSDRLTGEMGQNPATSRVTVHDGNVIETSQRDLETAVGQTESKKTLDGSKSSLSEKKNSVKIMPIKEKPPEEPTDENENPDWICKVHQLKKVLVFLHEDFTYLSQKYKKLQKKLFKRNINKTDAKGELAEIERGLEKKEEEITIVIGLYKEVLHLREEVKNYRQKYNLVVYEKALMMDGIKQSNSTHTQMSALLRKIQQFQDQLKL